MYYPIKIFYSEEDEGFIAIAPDLPGCSAFGKTAMEVIEKITIAKELWIKDAQIHHEAVPRPSPIEDTIKTEENILALL
ncbi:MAG: type II toxin-antitoxin system HicB family antitoxin [Candidatus Magnetoovum sp. WYHC-5]|nr:type II toxin-antitoxin system HicB family antitoxin [Candidatus Magnetoovum sp. WYHC-5]